MINFAFMSSFQFKEFTLRDDNCGMKICSESVLLAAWAIARTSEQVLSIIDVGAGSGLLSLLAAQLCPGAVVTGLEIDPGACADARANFASSPWSRRLILKEGHFADHTPREKAGMIISNPPFFALGDRSPDLPRAGARHEDTLTYSALLDYSTRYLSDDGILATISPADRRVEITFSAELAGLHPRAVCRVRTAPAKAPQRLLWIFSRHDGPCHEEEISLRNPDGSYSAAYCALVGALYAWMPGTKRSNE